MPEAQQFGKYLLLRKLAAGGMGEVFLAKQQGPEGFEKFLVIKRILSHHTDNPDYIDMFFAEARLAAKMSHSNIVQIYEMGEIDGGYFIAMEYVNGKSMKDIIDASRKVGMKLEVAHIADMIINLSLGLGYAHNLTDMGGNILNIIHRDINPHNVLVSYGGETKIIDFGIAKSDVNEHKTETGTIKGKFVYMSPEQSAAEKIDKRSDIFSIGIVLYEMLSGENPFQKANIVLSLDAIQRTNPPLPSTIDPAFEPFDPIVEKVLAKKADDRYQECADLAHDLQRLALPKPSRSLKAMMQDLFKENIEKEQRFIQDVLKNPTFVPTPRRNTNTGITNVGDQPGFEPPLPSMQATGQLTPMPSMATGVQTSQRTTALSRRRKKRQMVYVILAAISIVTVGAVAAMLNTNPKPLPDSPTTNTINLDPPPPAPVPTAVVTPPPTPTPTPTPAPPKNDPKPDTKADAKKNDKKRPGKDDDDKKVVVISGGDDKPTPRPDPKPDPEPPKSAGGGHLMINSVPPAPIFRDGSQVGGGGTTRVDIKGNGSGVIKVGDGSSPFTVTFQYRLNASKQLEVSIDTKPWAILSKGGISLGKTPRPWFPAGEGLQRFEFKSPLAEGTMTVVLKFNPG